MTPNVKVSDRPLADGPLDRRVGHQPIHDEGHCLRKCPYLQVWRHPFWHHAAWCWKQMRDLSYYDGLIADCLHHKPDENLTRLPVEMVPNRKSQRHRHGVRWNDGLCVKR